MTGFNPHPAGRPDATISEREPHMLQLLFQSSSGLPAGCNVIGQDVVGRAVQVSILIRPSGRMQPTTHALLGGLSVFQSSSGLPAGCNIRVFRHQRHPGVSIRIRPSGRMQHGSSGGCMELSSFNPHPAFRPDATTAPARNGQLLTVVSILIRPSGRMQPVNRWATGVVVLLFQSSSGLPAGCNYVAMSARCAKSRFQSSSGLPAGCNGGSGQPWRRLMTGFNPHPAFRPDATSLPRCKGPPHNPFQSSSGLPAGCNGRRDAAAGTPVLVSILIRPSGRMQPSRW